MNKIVYGDRIEIEYGTVENIETAENAKIGRESIEQEFFYKFKL